MWMFWLIACLGGARHEVDLADLAPLGARELAALGDEEHAVSIALTMLEGARAEAERSDLRVDEARAILDQTRLEHDTARAALDAARASRDPLRIGSAEGVEESARYDVEMAKARLDWQEASRRLAEHAIDLAESRVELREAELELARYDLLERSGRGLDYRRSDFADQVDVAQELYDEQEREHERLTKATTRAWEDWRRYEQYPDGRYGTR